MNYIRNIFSVPCPKHSLKSNMFVIEDPFVITHYIHDDSCWDSEKYNSEDDDDEEDAMWLECLEKGNRCKIASQTDVDDAVRALHQAFAQCPQPADTIIQTGPMCFTELFADDISAHDLDECALFFQKSYKNKRAFRGISKEQSAQFWTNNSMRQYAHNNLQYSIRNIFEDEDAFHDCIRNMSRMAFAGNIIIIGRLQGSTQIACACMLLMKADLHSYKTPFVWSAEITNVCAYPFGRGYGAQIMTHVKSFYCRNKQLGQLVLNVERDEDFERNCRFYARAGFQVQRLPRYMMTDDCLRMVYDAEKKDACEYSLVYALPGSLVRNQRWCDRVSTMPSLGTTLFSSAYPQAP